MKMKKICCLVLAGATMCGLCACGNQNGTNSDSSATQQQNEKALVTYHTPEAIKSRGELAVGIKRGGFEYFKNKDGNDVGYEVEIANALAKEIGEEVKVKFVESESDAMFDSLEKGEIDIALASIESTPKLKERFTLSNSYWPWEEKPYSIHVLKSNSEKYKALSDFSTAKIGVLDKHFQEVGENYLPSATFTVFESEEKCTEKLKNGEIDAVITETPDENTKSPFGDEVTKSSVTIPEKAEDMGLFVAMMKDNTELQKTINNVISKHKENGDIEKWVYNAYKELLSVYAATQNQSENSENKEENKSEEANQNTEEKNKSENQ